ncbi:hypothetical protein EVG20_g7948 [Dentipellis fragilis]|uniref:Protein kinase domain-containing protein n=1 Tax=Dentipellis fragilis TaxID=205917 RepID=A0A4Y9YBP2_9AGAM|nr:hypothetical protein EVG20_g7948 [Dentipellis fragilis]
MSCIHSGRIQAFISVIALSVMAGIAFSALGLRRKRRNERILAKLPSNLEAWRRPNTIDSDDETIWKDADDILREAGLIQWPYMGEEIGSSQGIPVNTCHSQNGYSYVTPCRDVATKGPGTRHSLGRFMYLNPLKRAARTTQGTDVIVRVMAIRNHGRPQLNILRKLATGPQILLSNNHTLPILQEIHFEYISFATFPKVGESMLDVYGRIWPRNSVGDVLDMITQALEDAFSDNFLVQWHPESLRTMEVSVSKPRVFLIDFEVATSFEADCPKNERLCTGCPMGSSLIQSETYARPRIPEMNSNEPYDPFKLDVWQLGTAIEPIDNILDAMKALDSAVRLDANDVLAKLTSAIHHMPPLSLLIPFEMLEDPMDF